jgi:hypothetical protein
MFKFNSSGIRELLVYLVQRNPPSIGITVPVTMEDAGDSRNLRLSHAKQKQMRKDKKRESIQYDVSHFGDFCESVERNLSTHRVTTLRRAPG